MTNADLDDIREAFHKIDVDESGTITKEELYNRFLGADSKFNVSKNDFDVLFDIIDKDKSGSIDFEEYVFFIEQIKKVEETHNNKRRRHSVMKVSTQLDSLSSSCEHIRPQMKKKKSTRSSRLLDVKFLKNFTTKHDLFDVDEDKSLSRVNKNKPRDERSRKLRFFDVEVRKYEITVSDNPGVKAGVAIELGWNYDIEERSHIDNFEEVRSKERSKNFMKEKKLTRLEREKILKQFGATEKEIQEASKRAADIRGKRKKSISMRQHDKFYEKVERVERRMSSGIMKVFGRSRSTPAKINEIPDIERLHPTLMAMMGVDDSVGVVEAA